MLYIGQFKEDLQLSFVSALDALLFKELCMAAKHEEKILAEIKKYLDIENISSNTKCRPDRQVTGSGTCKASN